MRHLAAALVAAALLLAGCGHAPQVAPQAATEGIAEANAVTADGRHNDFDVMLLQMMIAQPTSTTPWSWPGSWRPPGRTRR